MGVTGIVNTLAYMRLLTAAVAQSTSPLQDYKALVCLFLHGGNDSNNLLVPRGGDFRTDYANARGALALSASKLIPIYPENDSRLFGLHPNASGMASLFNAGRLAFVSNVGTLSYPIAHRDEYIQGLVPLPPQLFSHADQQLQWQTSVPDRPYAGGWGARVADLLNASYNSTSKISMSISLAGVNSFQRGTAGGVTQYVMTPSGVVSLRGYANSYGNYRAALDASGNYLNNDHGKRLKAFDQIMNMTHSNLFEEQYRSEVRSARSKESFIGSALAAAAATGVSFDTLFKNAKTPLGDQLKMVARMIAGRNSLGNARQVFFCQVSGYDTHSEALVSHATLISQLSAALSAFYNTLVQLNIANSVTLFTASDFNRTLTPNGTGESAGSDHAWGGHAVVLGGAVQGKKLYGAFPSLKLGTDNDLGRGRGRWIPTTAVDQYSAVIAKWFGVDSNSMEVIFPNLGRFNSPFSSSANLAFLPTA